MVTAARGREAHRMHTYTGARTNIVITIIVRYNTVKHTFTACNAYTYHYYYYWYFHDTDRIMHAYW